MMSLAIFILLSFGISFLIDFVILIPNAENPLIFAIGGAFRMLIPALSIIILKAFKIDHFSRLDIGLCVGKAKWLFIAPLIPIIVWIITALLHKIFAIEVLSLQEIVTQIVETNQKDEMSKQFAVEFIQSNYLFVLFIIIGASVLAGVSINLLFALGEEIGWRGYLVYKLSNKNFYLQTLLIGIIWGLWHAPLIYVLGYNYSGFTGFKPLVTFIGFTIGVSYTLNNLRHISGSVFPPAIVHSTLNALGGMFLISFPQNPFISGAAGIIPTIAWILVGFLLDIIRIKHGQTNCIKQEQPKLT